MDNDKSDLKKDDSDLNLENDEENNDESDNLNENISEDFEKIQLENNLLKEELSKINDKYLRLAAEYKNYQERSKKRKNEYSP